MSGSCAVHGHHAHEPGPFRLLFGCSFVGGPGTRPPQGLCEITWERTGARCLGRRGKPKVTKKQISLGWNSFFFACFLLSQVIFNDRKYSYLYIIINCHLWGILWNKKRFLYIYKYVLGNYNLSKQSEIAPPPFHLNVLLLTLNIHNKTNFFFKLNNKYDVNKAMWFWIHPFKNKGYIFIKQME